MKTTKIFALIGIACLCLWSCKSSPQAVEPEMIASIANVAYYIEPQSSDKQSVQTLYWLTPEGTKRYIIPAEYGIDSIKFIGDHFFIAYKQGLSRVYNNAGSKLFKTDYQQVSFKDSLFVLYDGSKFFAGLCDEYLSGEPNRYFDGGPYDSLLIGNHQEFFYKQDQHWSVFKANSTNAIPGDCLQIISIDSRKTNSNCYLVQDNRKRWAFYDAGGKKVCNASTSRLKLILSLEPEWQIGTIKGVSIEQFAP